MSLPSNRRADPGSLGPETILAGVAVGLILIIGGSLYAATRIGHQLAGTADTVPTDPFAVVIGLFNGKVTWPAAGTQILAAGGAVAVVLAVLLIIGWRKISRNTTRVDRSAAVLGRGKEIEPLTRKNAIKSAKRLGVVRLKNDPPGVAIGRAVAGGAPLYGTYEDMHLDIWGPRTGKTTSRAIPAIMDAPGAVLVTSNRRDVVDATRDGRAAVGEVWVFDPQGLIGEPPTSWWWDPLSYVTDEVKAQKLAEHFATGSRDPGARTDAFFDNSGQDLLAGLLLAAALDHRPITDVYVWLTRPADDTPVEILRQHDYPLIERQVAGVINAPEKQRGGIYGTAQQMAACLTNRQVAAWVTPQNSWHDGRRRFNPTTFLDEGGTLYSLSKEGRGTAGPLVTALTVAVVEAAEEIAARSRGGRLPVPLIGVLDEAANVCRWKELPNLYSHYGGRGIILMTILQSWSQGVDVWGESGMNKLFSAANIFVYGGGAKEDKLETISKLVGDYDRVSSSISYGRGHRTVSRQLVRQRILDMEQLSSIPKGRAMVLASGARATLISTQPWMTGPHADVIRASILAHDPEGVRTLAEAEQELEDVARNLATKEVPDL